jgi:hypothetical protein
MEPMGRLAARVVVLWVAVAVVGAAFTACGGGGDGRADGPTATVPTTPPDPYAVPAVIDEAYVNRVLAALDQAVGDVVRIVVSTKTLSPEAIERLQALYVGDALQLEFQIFQADLFNDLAGYEPSPGNVRTRVTKLITVRPACIFAQVSRDFSEVSIAPDPRLTTQWVELIPLTPSADPSDHNVTPWMFAYDGFQRDFSQPEDPCAKVS